MKDVSKLLREVYYYNDSLWYKISSCSKHKLLNNKNKLKSFIVLDVTSNIVYTRDEFIEKYYSGDINNIKVIEDLDSLKYKVYKKITLKGKI